MMAPERLRAFLAGIQRGAMTRAGYERVYLRWDGTPATKAQKADLEAALRLGLIAWPSMVPGTAAVLTDSGRVLLRSVPPTPADLRARIETALADTQIEDGTSAAFDRVVDGLVQAVRGGK